MVFELVIIVIGWLYPAFVTYESLNGSLRSQVIWMKYWIVFGIFNAFHFLTGCLEPWLPFLSGFKLFVLCWLLPSLGNGSQYIHDEVLDPMLKRNKESINQTMDSISQISSALLSELIKMIYHLLVDVVEQCWLITRDSNDIHVTPRLQVAINEVIAELHTARDAAIFKPRPPQQANKRHRLEENNGDNISDDILADSDVPTLVPNTLVPTTAAVPGVTVDEAEDYEEEKEREHEQNTVIEVEEIPIKTSGGAFRAAALSHMTDDSLSLRILLAELLSAQRMQLGQQLSEHEHLAPVNTQHTTVTTAITPVNKAPCLPKPIWGKRKEQQTNAAQQQQHELKLDLKFDRV